jgi:hypothetical protein
VLATLCKFARGRQRVCELEILLSESVGNSL